MRKIIAFVLFIGILVGSMFATVMALDPVTEEVELINSTFDLDSTGTSSDLDYFMPYDFTTAFVTLPDIHDIAPNGSYEHGSINEPADGTFSNILVTDPATLPLKWGTGNKKYEISFDYKFTHDQIGAGAAATALEFRIEPVGSGASGFAYFKQVMTTYYGSNPITAGMTGTYSETFDFFGEGDGIASWLTNTMPDGGDMRIDIVGSKLWGIEISNFKVIDVTDSENPLPFVSTLFAAETTDYFQTGAELAAGPFAVYENYEISGGKYRASDAVAPASFKAIIATDPLAVPLTWKPSAGSTYRISFDYTSEGFDPASEIGLWGMGPDGAVIFLVKVAGTEDLNGTFDKTIEFSGQYIIEGWTGPEVLADTSIEILVHSYKIQGVTIDNFRIAEVTTNEGGESEVPVETESWLNVDLLETPDFFLTPAELQASQYLKYEEYSLVDGVYAASSVIEPPNSFVVVLKTDPEELDLKWDGRTYIITLDFAFTATSPGDAEFSIIGMNAAGEFAFFQKMSNSTALGFGDTYELLLPTDGIFSIPGFTGTEMAVGTPISILILGYKLGGVEISNFNITLDAPPVEESDSEASSSDFDWENWSNSNSEEANSENISENISEDISEDISENISETDSDTNSDTISDDVNSESNESPNTGETTNIAIIMLLAVSVALIYILKVKRNGDKAKT